jgi:hypothetical protein
MSAQRPCVGVAGWLRGHSFTAQFNVGAPTLKSVKSESGGASGLARAIDASMPRTFAGALCGRCGLIIHDRGNA